MRPLEQLRVKQVREELDPLGDSRTWPCEVGIGIDGNNSRSRKPRYRLRGLDRPCEAVTARRDDHDLRVACRD